MPRSNGEAGTLSAAALIARTGVSRSALIRLRQQGLIPTIAPRRGLGKGRGTTPLEYPEIAVSTINRYDELGRKSVEEKRWLLWLEGHPVRIASDLADTLGRLKLAALQIRTLDDVETRFPAELWKPSNMPRGDPLRVIFRNLTDEERRSAVTLVICFVLGIRLPLFDEPNPYPWQVFKRALGLPKEWGLPPGLFDAVPYLHEQLCNALLTATADELEGARAASRLLSRLLDNPENTRRGGIVFAGAALPWRPIKLCSLLWPSPLVRATHVGLVVLGMRLFKSALGEGAGSAFASMISGMRIFFPDSGPISPGPTQIPNMKVQI